MSLHHLAQQVQSKGRGEDTQLIHMTPKEVQGLQALAMKHGGSLTINPQTGLPEAGFLSSLLPTILGLGLAPFTGGLSAAMLVGGGYTLATGSLKKGLMAGLGAYGGAGLGSSLSSLGAETLSTAAPTIGNAANLGVGTAGNIANTSLVNPAVANMASGAGSAGAGVAGATSGIPALSTAATNANILASPMLSGAAPTALTPASQMAQAVTAVPNPTLLNTIQNTNAAMYGSPAMSYGAGTQGIGATAQGLTATAAPTTYANMGEGLSKLNSMDALKAFGKDNVMNIGMAAAPMLMPNKFTPPKQDQGMIRPYTMDRTQNPEAYAQGEVGGMTRTPVYGQPFDSSERMFFNDRYTAGTPYAAPGPEYKATGGLTALAVGGPVEEMAAQNAVGQNTGYPMANLQTDMYANPQVQRPMSTNVVSPSGDVNVDPYTGEQKFAEGGGISHLGDYSDGGRLLRGPGDGVSDDIPAQIGDKQPARLADGEFVVPARIVSELGNGSTEAGARQLYKMMERVQHNRRKSVGKDKVAVDAKSAKFLPA